MNDQQNDEEDGYEDEEDYADMAAFLTAGSREQFFTELFPPQLCKYLRPDSATFVRSVRDVLVHSRLFLSSPSTFNDPFDTCISVQIHEEFNLEEYYVEHAPILGVTVEHIRARFPTSEAVRDVQQRSVSKTLQEIGIHSLTAELYEPLLWAHYAGSHRGIAFIFDVEPGQELDPIPAYPIRYVEKLPYARIQAKERSWEELSIAMYKTDEWRYESEWRIFAPGKASTHFDIDPRHLHGIVYGLNCDDAAIKSLVREFISEREARGFPPITEYVAERSADLLGLQIVRVKDSMPINFPHLDRRQRKKLLATAHQ